MGWKKIRTKKDGAFVGTPELNIDMYVAFIKENGFTHYARDPIYTSLKDFMMTDKDIGSGNPRKNPPYYDHIRLFKGPLGNVLTYQPYHNKEYVEPRVREWCDEHGFDYKIYGNEKAWYYPFNENMCLIVMMLTHNAPDSGSESDNCCLGREFK